MAQSKNGAPPDTRTLRFLKQVKENDPMRRALGGDEDNDAFEVDAATLYEEGFKLAEAVCDGTLTADAATSNVFAEVQAVPKEGWTLAKRPATRAMLDGQNPDDPESDRGKRARALEATRRLVTALARQQNGRGYALRITVPDEEAKGRWRL